MAVLQLIASLFRHTRLLPLLSALLMSNAAAEPIPISLYADENYPPYSFVENRQMNGIYTQIIRRALERIPEYKVQLVPVPWQRGLVLLEKGKAFALYPPYFRPVERPLMKYSEPLLTEQTVIFCHSELLSKRALKVWPNDYFGLRIGINAGFLIGGKQFDAAARAGLLSVDQAQGSRSNLLKLLRGRIDCYVNDRLSILWEHERIRKEGLIEASYRQIAETGIVSGEQGYLGYTELNPERYPYRDDFMQKFNAVIREMRRSGEIREITAKFLSR